MSISTYSEADQNELQLTAVPFAERDQRRRIMAALGISRGRLPHVDDQTLSTYCRYLSAHLSLPFTAWYPAPKTSQENSHFRLTVVELLDPREHIGDQFDGIFCKTRKDNFEVNLPLLELQVPHDELNFQLIEDYWFWFWNWR
jgi:hypothetical protein